MELSEESIKLIKDYSYITKDEEYQKLKQIPRHTFTNTYDHSIRVALLSRKLSEILKTDCDKAIRAALLHDFCMVNYYEKNDHKGLYIFYHPKEAVMNSKRWHLAKIEEKAILSHMFPFGRIPTSRIGWSVTIADKIIAIYEKVYGVSRIKTFIIKAVG